MNPILSVNRTGIPWEYLPHDFPPFKTVYDHYAKWEADGTTEQVHSLLRDRTRRANARNGEPAAAAVDARSVKTSSNVSEASQGIDAGKRVKGGKRHLITYTLGLVLTVLVTAASVHDSVGGRQVTEPAAAHPNVTKVWADGGYQTRVNQHGAGLGIDVQAVQRPRVKGFHPLPSSPAPCRPPPHRPCALAPPRTLGMNPRLGLAAAAAVVPGPRMVPAAVRVAAALRGGGGWEWSGGSGPSPVRATRAVPPGVIRACRLVSSVVARSPLVRPPPQGRSS
ncbi:transposase [Streptomyces sp. NPDC090741]|uniref:transposase n=1 Tax=Streptomyces sp. NPDC090741 TaxID=3365967 RepID=UPI003813A363